MAPKIILAIVTPLLSLTSIRIGFGLELCIAEPVVSEVLKWNPITVHCREISIGEDFAPYRVEKFTGPLSPPPRRLLLLFPFHERKKREKKEQKIYTKLPNCIFNFHTLPSKFTSWIVKQTLAITLEKIVARRPTWPPGAHRTHFRS